MFEGSQDNDPLATPARLVTAPRDHTVVSYAKVESAYNTDKQCWISQVHLTIANESQYDAQEYVTEFHLPAGAWIDDYYLWIGEEKVSGLLAERRAATWVYQNITSYRQDPGIMYYLDPETVALRVFPFGSLEKRKTGFQVMHKEPFALALGDQILQLGTAADVIQRPLLSYDSNAVYLSAIAKRRLPKVQREPVYHLLLMPLPAARPFCQPTKKVLRALHATSTCPSIV
ncbi:MAG: MSEP-CTERM sorting domain-containing protein [Bacteroidia bacterium]|nr:MSEP-CTERM sorting domain-containing protein [Bacteroidia bacterium]